MPTRIRVRPEYNKQLSQRRAESVVKLLTEKYNIDKKRVQIVANGSDSQLYPQNNNWNRIVVFAVRPSDRFLFPV